MAALLSRAAPSSTLSSYGAANRTSLFAFSLGKLHGQRAPFNVYYASRRADIWKFSAMVESAMMEASRPEHEQSALTKEAILQTRADEKDDDMFNWNDEWYPVAVVDNLDRRIPTAVTIMGRDLVVWWDRNGESWQVWEDKCPHRLAPLSEGRINEKGELQCSYHGWCFAGCTGSCTFIPQAPPDGAPVWESKRACASVYPSVEQEGLLWFWPDTRPESKDIAKRKLPPSIPALADPSFKDELHSRNLPYGYEQLIENLMDPAHVPFAHHGLQGFRNMAKPLNYKVEKVEKSGYIGDAERGPATFIAPCIFTLDSVFNSPKNDGSSTAGKPQKRIVLVFICIPVSPGQSKVIWAFCKNFSIWIDPLIPRWFIHLRQMLVLDSDMYLLHKTERKLAEFGNTAWEKACYVPTSSDAFVIAFRKWLNTYGGGRPKWGGRDDGLPPTPPKEQLMDRYWSHVKICRHCSAAMQFFEGVGVILQALSVAIAAVLGAAAIRPIPQLRNWSLPMVVVAIASSLASRWLSHFVHKTYRFHDYNHALVK
ncbi:hypothetical protein GOP47_0024321 [Adiantum capillus-veneris]|uniref:Rieske domain-containing protein n=1 Tax=Adiantum capillus-veneris TaxID=13818 RepID=A0A9D4U1I0_ADICA|nr:hypothetical protein GOP47_0024321 [Adiantum capillus-veneris]